jgi:hypothetical protein
MQWVEVAAVDGIDSPSRLADTERRLVADGKSLLPLQQQVAEPGLRDAPTGASCAWALPPTSTPWFSFERALEQPGQAVVARTFIARYMLSAEFAFDPTEYRKARRIGNRRPVRRNRWLIVSSAWARAVLSANVTTMRPAR